MAMGAIEVIGNLPLKRDLFQSVYVRGEDVDSRESRGGSSRVLPAMRNRAFKRAANGAFIDAKRSSYDEFD